MRVAKLLKGLSILCITLFFLCLSTLYYYMKSEAESHKELRASCEIMDISILLNDYYFWNEKYPKSDSWVDSITDEINNIKCGRKIDVIDGEINDPWGSPYVYRQLYDNEVIITISSRGNHEVRLVDGRITTKGNSSVNRLKKRL